ncbi:MAG: 3-keto-5-aminohexanoate cleavage protein [Bacteroidota bacterium]
MNIIINFCPTGMVPTKAMNPNVPISPSEIIEQTHEAYELGITIAHLHARLDDGTPTYQNSIYGKIIEGVRRYCPGLIVCVSSSGRTHRAFEQRSEVIELRPDMCSLTLSSLNFASGASINQPDMIARLLDKILDYGVHPELECFDLGMINYGKYLLQKRNIDRPMYWNLLFGNIAGWQPKFDQIGVAVNAIPEGHHIALAGLGRYQLAVNSMAIAAGFGVRVGLEDNLWEDQKGTKSASNIGLLKRVHQLLAIHDREVMASKELGLQNQKVIV